MLRPFPSHRGPSRHRILVIADEMMVVEIAGKEWDFQIQPIEPGQLSRNAHRPHFPRALNLQVAESSEKVHHELAELVARLTIDTIQNGQKLPL